MSEDKKSSGPAVGHEGSSQPATDDLLFLEVPLLKEWYAKLTKAEDLYDRVAHYHIEFNKDLLKIKVTVENSEAIKSFFKYFKRFFSAYSKDNGCYYGSTPHFIRKYIMQKDLPNRFIKFLATEFPDQVLYAVWQFEFKAGLNLSPVEQRKYEKAKIALLENLSWDGCGDNYIHCDYKDNWRATLQKKYHAKITAARTVDDLNALENRIKEIALLKYPFRSHINCTHTAAHNRLGQSSSSQSETTEGVFYKGNISKPEYRDCSPIYVELLELIDEKRRKFASLHNLPKERKETTVFFAPSSFSQTTQAPKINPTKNKADGSLNKADGSFAALIPVDDEVEDVRRDSKHESKTVSPTIQQSDVERLQKENEQLKAELAREKARAGALAAEVAALKAAAPGTQGLSISSQRGLKESMFNTSSRTATKQQSGVIHHPLAPAPTVKEDPPAQAASLDIG